MRDLLTRIYITTSLTGNFNPGYGHSPSLTTLLAFNSCIRIPRQQLYIRVAASQPGKALTSRQNLNKPYLHYNACLICLDLHDNVRLP